MPETHSVLLVKAPEAAALLSISERTLWALTNRNCVPHRRIGRGVRYSPEELQEWIRLGCPIEADAADVIHDNIDRARQC